MAIVAVDEILRSRCVPADRCPLAAIRLVTPHAGLLPVQQIGQHRAVGDIGRGGHHRVDQLAAAVDPEMPLHPEVPLVALLGLMHLGIARLAGILGRRQRIDDRGINDCAGCHLQSIHRQVPLYLVEQPPAQIVRSSRWRKRHTVVSSGTGSRPRSIATQRRIACEW